MDSAKLTLLKNSQTRNNFIEKGTLLERKGMQDAEAFTRRQFTPDCWECEPIEASKLELALLWAVVLGGCVVWYLALCFFGVI